MAYITTAEELLAEIILASHKASEEDPEAHSWYWWNDSNSDSSLPRLFPVSLAGLTREEVAAYFETHRDDKLAIVRFDEHGQPTHLVLPLEQVLGHFADFLEYTRIHFPELRENRRIFKQVFERGEFRAYLLDPEAYWQTHHASFQDLDQELRVKREQQEAALREFWDMPNGASEKPVALSEATSLMQTIQNFSAKEKSPELKSVILQKPRCASIATDEEASGISR